MILPPAPRAAGRGARAASDTDAARPIRLGDFELRGETSSRSAPAPNACDHRGDALAERPSRDAHGHDPRDRPPAGVRFAIDAKDADIEQLLSLLPESLLAEKEKLEASGRASIAARVAGSAAPGSEPTASGTVVIGESRIAFEGMPGAIDDLRGQVRFSNERLDIDSLFAAFDGVPFQMRGSVAPLEYLYVDLSIAGTLPLGMIGRWPGARGRREPRRTCARRARARASARAARDPPRRTRRCR